MRYKVLIPQPISQVGMDFLKEHGYVAIECAPDEQSIIENIGCCDAVTSRTCLYTKKIIDSAPKLKIISNYGVGTDNIEIEYATEKGIWVTNTPGANAISVAEHTMYLLFCAARNAYRASSELRKGNWLVKDEVNGIELTGKTVGIIGTGNIGQAFAKMCHLGFDMNIIGYDPFIDSARVPDFIRLTESLDELMSKADIVSLHMPFIKEIGAILGKHELGLMKPRSILINTSRGNNIDEVALISALKNNQIWAAGLDVMAQEPINMDNELLNLSNVFLTPHHASLTYEGRDKMTMGVVENIHAVLMGKEPINPVNSPKLQK